MSSNDKTMLMPSALSENKLTDFSKNSADFSDFKDHALADIGFTKYLEQYQGSDNPLIETSSVIFKNIHQIQHAYDIGEIDEVRKKLIETVNAVSESLTKKEVDKNQMLLCKYLICTFMDELISSTFWGKEHNWSSSSLLGTFFHETYGGNKFFQLLDQLQESKAKHINLLELMYVMLSLGFEGKYRIQAQGKKEVSKIRENLYQQIKIVKETESLKFYTEHETKKSSKRFFYKGSHRIIYISLGVIFCIIYGLLTISLSSKEDELMVVMQSKYNKYMSGEIKPLAEKGK